MPGALEAVEEEPSTEEAVQLVDSVGEGTKQALRSAGLAGQSSEQQQPLALLVYSYSTVWLY